ncbi:MAG: hypothetical protein ABGX16_24030 [Pirellulales bacterium]
MPIYLSRPFRLISLCLLAVIPIANANATKQGDPSGVAFTHQITFQLTFSHEDMIWLGDPASPTASVYPKPDARPIATDLCVRTLAKDHLSPNRRYLHEARIAKGTSQRNVYAFTSEREKMIGTINGQGHFSTNATYRNNRKLLPSWPTDASILTYDAEENRLYYNVLIPGPLVSESLDFLPLTLVSSDLSPVTGRYSIDYSITNRVPSNGAPDSDNTAEVSLQLVTQASTITLAHASVPRVFHGDNVQTGSFDNQDGTYLPESVYRAGGTHNRETVPSVTVTIPGKFTSRVQSDGENLVVANTLVSADPSKDSPATIAIDGNFDDWRNITGIDDPRGDVVPYLEYIADVDLLEFKVAHDDQHLYLYARVAGQIGRSHPHGGRSYFYAYLDVDHNSNTGFLPSRDDDCYFGVDIGDDCEVQFEFVDNTLRKTFYGFCGIGGDDNVLKQIVTLGKSQYGRFNKAGVERANYKSEYIFRDGVTQITEDLKLGTSDTIRLAVSPDGNEVEVVSTFTGFLRNPAGQPTIQSGQTIDLAVGMECDSKAYPDKTNWAADSTRAIRGYTLGQSGHHATSE